MRELVLNVIDGLTPAFLERVPMLAVGSERLPGSIAEIAPAILSHFGIAPPRYPGIFAVAA